jgi:hypothetical protein
MWYRDFNLYQTRNAELEKHLRELGGEMIEVERLHDVFGEGVVCTKARASQLSERSLHRRQDPARRGF